MDPNACLMELLAAIAEGNVDELRERADDMGDWLAAGGFKPDIGRCLREMGEAS